MARKPWTKAVTRTGFFFGVAIFASGFLAAAVFGTTAVFFFAGFY